MRHVELHYPRPQSFEGREEFLNELHAHVNTVRGHVGAAVLTGPAGIGKTRLAIEYAYRHTLTYTGGVYYINARRNWTYELAKIAQQRGLRPIRRVTAQLEHDRWLAISLQRYLADDLKEPILLIFDNISDPREIRDREIGQGLHVSDLKAHLIAITESPTVPEPFQAFPVEPLADAAVEQIIGEQGAAFGPMLGNFPQSAYLLKQARELYPEFDVEALKTYLEEQDPVGALLAWHRDHLTPDELSVWTILATFRRESVVPRQRLALLLGCDNDTLNAALARLGRAGLVEIHLNGDIELHVRVRRFIRRWIPTYRDKFAEHLQHFIDNMSTPAIFFQQVQQRGIRDVLADLEELSIASLDDGPPPVDLNNLKRLVEWEAPYLRDWHGHSIWPVQQIRERAHHQQLDDLRDSFDAWLSNHAHFRSEDQWRYPLKPSMLETYWGHEGPISCVINIDGEHIVTASHDGTLRLWDMFAGQTLRNFTGHRGKIETVAFFDYDSVLSAGEDKIIRLWDIHTGQIKRVLEGHAWSVQALARVDEERILSAGDDHTMRLWNIERGGEIRAFKGHTEQVKALLVLDPKSALTASLDGTVRRWNLITGEQTALYEGHAAGVIDLVRVDHDHVASAGMDKHVHVWHIEDATIVKTLTDEDRSITSLCMLDSGDLAVGYGDGTLTIWNPLEARRVHTIDGHVGAVTGIAEVEQQQLVTVSNDRTLRHWDISLPTPPLETTPMHGDWVISINPISQTDALTTSADRTLAVFNVDTGAIKERLLGHADGVNVALKIDDFRVMSGAADGAVWLWTSVGSKKLREFGGHTDEVTGLVRLDAAHLLSIGCDGQVRQWEFKTGRLVKTFRAASIRPTALVAINERAFVTADSDHVVRLWDLDKERVVRELKGHTSMIRGLALMGQTRVLSVSNDKTIRLWSLITGVGKVMEGHEDYVTGIAAIDDRYCVSVSFDRTLRLWDTHTTEQTAILRLSDPLLSVAFLGPNRIAVGDLAGKVRVLRVYTGG